MEVAYVDLAREFREIRLEVSDAIERVLLKGWFILGEEVEAFEEEFASYVGARYCVGVGNGVDAIKLALMAMDIGPGDEVIVPANTCTPTWLGVTASGAALRPVDPNGRTYNVEPDAIERAIGERTRGVVPVHLYGQPADMTSIARLAHERGLRLVHDCAQAHGAYSHGKPLGAFGDAAAWSFYPTKNLGAFGDAGAVTTNDGDVAGRVRGLRNCGAESAGIGGLTGANSRLDEIQAAVLRVKLCHLPEWNERRRKFAALYLEGLRSEHVRLPDVPDHATPSWHMFVVRMAARDGVKNYLQSNGVETLVRYADLPYLEAAFSGGRFDPCNFPVSELIRREVLSLPVGPHLDFAQVEKVVELLNALPADIAEAQAIEAAREAN